MLPYDKHIQASSSFLEIESCELQENASFDPVPYVQDGNCSNIGYDWAHKHSLSVLRGFGWSMNSSHFQSIIEQYMYVDT